MRKILCLALVLALLSLSLTGCRKKAEEAAEEPAAEGEGYAVTDGQQANSVPDPLATLTPQERAAMLADMEEQAASDDMPAGAGGDYMPADDLFAPIGAAPTAEPVQTETANNAVPEAPVQQAPAVNPATFQYAAVMDDSLDYTFNYPTHWENIPGIYTVCFREKVEKGDFPARISICRKKLVHTPDEIAMMEQLTSYMKMVSEHYDEKTFQTSTPEKGLRFMNHKDALANTYLAYWGTVEVKGYVIGVAIDRTLYVLHFCATYEDYNALESAMLYMVNSVQLKETDKK